MPSRASLLWLLSLGLFALHILVTTLVARQFGNMPPAFHDEYSYIFQAKTFLAGRLYSPADDGTQLFSQMHVLNDNGVFASRYFPGVGLWLAPWVAIDRAYWGQYLAGGIVVLLVLWIGYELPRFRAADETNCSSTQTCNRSMAMAFIAALFCALSPALILFDNLLVSHPPTLLGLVGFVYCYLRSIRSEALGWPLLGGSALSLAMLCRPLTAFGFAVPFAIHLCSLVWRGALSRRLPRVSAALGPIVIAIAGLAAYNAALTGNPLESPYGL